ncbi:MAG: enoyl-CoA hydratase [Rhizobiales bacterium]|nr:enoyl-CoA hydratase [Hyphomicrobiales bacterium]
MAEVLKLRPEAPEGPVLSELRNGILVLTLSNPPANALSMETMALLQAELDRARDDRSVRVVVIAAAGKLFCAGHDLKEMTAHRADSDKGKAYFEETFATCSRLMQSIVNLPKPVIAAVDGIATAAGCQLVACCDLAIVTDRATFGVNGIDVGLFCTTPSVALSRNISRKHAMEMLLTGEMIDAQTARGYGLVNRVVPPEYLNQIVNKYAETIAAKSPTAVRMGKKGFYEQAGLGLAEAYDSASRVMIKNMLAHDAEEGIAAFIGKRKPQWTGE